jgi:hypothetical protein
MTRNIVIIMICAQATFCNAANFGLARHATPVLNTPDFSSVFGGKDCSALKTDSCGQVRGLEYIALPGTVFKILGEIVRGGTTIYHVETEEYQAPPGIRLYVESRFLSLHENTPPARKRNLPEREQILAALRKSVGSPYVWGGNVQSGVPELLRYSYRNIAITGNERLILAGLDCSGLLYQATDGWTPRNTSQLISFGRAVPIRGKTALEIARLLEPLDLIVWNGHVIIVLDQKTAIESRLVCGKPGNGGVVTTSLQKRLSEIMRTRQPADNWPANGKQLDVFVVRRWYGI